MRNPTFSKLKKNYLFAEVARHAKEGVLNLGIGDTSIPLPKAVSEKMASYAMSLATGEGYTGYQKEQGSERLRSLLSEKMYDRIVTPDEIFISDGAKGDLGRIQLLFSHVKHVAIQDPAYPVYRDGSLLQGVENVHLAPCLPENNFYPQLPDAPFELVYICNPNNPTGTALTRSQLIELVAETKERGAIMIYDSAYRFFISDPEIPRSIYEIPGAEKVAIEVNSFSKFAGFTGVRLGWVVVPDELCYNNGHPVRDDFSRIHSTVFNGASILAQAGGIAVLEEGYEACLGMVDSYQHNAKLLRDAFVSYGWTPYGGLHAPYVWIYANGLSSEEACLELLQKQNVLTVPGEGFGDAGKGFIRASALFSPYGEVGATLAGSGGAFSSSL